jgi:hypothetical protein
MWGALRVALAIAILAIAPRGASAEPAAERSSEQELYLEVLGKSE